MALVQAARQHTFGDDYVQSESYTNYRRARQGRLPVILVPI